MAYGTQAADQFSSIMAIMHAVRLQIAEMLLCWSAVSVHEFYFFRTTSLMVIGISA